jgi:NAD(P)-dependent dehydrogenase (short-subunit alcohol dehydrogenase family)
LNGAGADVLGVVTDVTDPDQVQALADAALERHGAIHVACNNAGVGGGGLSWETPLSTWEWVIGADLWSVIYGIRTFVPILIQQDAGYLVNTSSVAGLVAAPFMGPYNAAKHGVVALSETVFHELSLHAPHVKVSVLCPGWVNTNIADSARNRPAHLQLDDYDDDAPAMQGAAEMLRAFIEQGMPADEVAGKVLDAMRAEQFWILTHEDETDFWVDLVNRRLRAVQERSNPSMQAP